MTTEATTDSGSQSGTQGANPAASQTAGVQQNSQAPLTAEQYRQIAREESEKVWQSGKDRRFSKIESEQTNQRTLLDAIEAKMGSDPTLTLRQAERAVKLDQLLDGNPLAQTPPGSEANGAASDTVKRLIDRFKMDTSDPEVAQAIRDNTDIVDLSAALAGLQVTRKTSPTPSPVTSTPSTAGTSLGGGLSKAEIEEKAGLLNDLLAEPTKNSARIKALQSELGPDYA